MRKFLYVAIGIIVVGLASGLGNKDASKPAYTQAMAKTSGALACHAELSGVVRDAFRGSHTK